MSWIDGAAVCNKKMNRDLQVLHPVHRQVHHQVLHQVLHPEHLHIKFVIKIVMKWK